MPTKLTVHEREQLLKLAQSLNLKSRTVSIPSITQGERGERISLSFAQQRLWFLTQMDGGSEAYHIAYGVRVRGQLDKGALGRALDRLVERHEALRTTFVTVEGEAEQRIASVKESGFHLREHDLSRSQDAKRELESLIAEEANTGFDLAKGPLIRGRLIREAEEEHALLITMHHIVSDGWSMGVLFKELSTLYRAFVRGEKDPLLELEVQYADYAAWQRRWIEGEVLAQQAEYWKQNLAGAPEVLEVPADYARPAQQSYAGALMRVGLNDKLTAGLKELGMRHGTTLYMTLLAAWAVLLGRLSGQQDVVIGTPAANRGRLEIEGLIGFFVNTLVMRVDVSGKPTVREVLERVKKQALAAQQHQDIPFEQVVEIVQPVRSLAHSPLFQAMFALQDASMGRPELPGLQIESLESSPHIVSKFDLTLSLQEKGECIVGGLEFATALFERTTIERYAGYYRTLLENMVEADEAEAVDSLGMLGEAERRQVLYEWNQTERELAGAGSVHELFEEQARKTPEAVAVVFGDERLSYRGLNEQANRLAHYLCSKGVKREDRVAICLERSVEVVIAEIGILKTGGAYVPLDPGYPMERKALVISDSGARVLVTKEDMEALDLVGVRRVDIEEVMEWEGEGGRERENPGIGQEGEGLAYVMYTSGSTGQPKGVMVPHRGIKRLVTNSGYARWDGEGVAFSSNPAFDASTMEVWGPLLNGGRVVVIEQDTLLEPRRLKEELRRQGVSVMWMTVGLFNHYAEELKEEFERMKYLIVGGDALDAGVMRRMVEGGQGPKHLVNGYGPTETTTFALTHEIREVVERSIPIGRPIGNTRVYIVDGEMEPVPVGVVGEVCIGGAGVGRGYVNRGEITAERFVPDPYMEDGKDGKQGGGRMYRTGDLGRWRKEGTIEFVGRNDLQVKVRGFRIELEEIEARLGEYDGIKEAVVVARKEAGGEKRLVAYYTLEAGVENGEAEESTVRTEELRRYLAEKLPEYMVPAAYVRLEKVPLTVNGKLDRKALPAPEEDAYGTREYEAPQGEIETAIGGIWAEVLKVERVGRQDNFFTLGGHSLLAIKVIERIRRMGLHIDVAALFATPTLAGLAATVSGDAGESRGIEIPENRIPAGCEAITPDMLPLVELTQEEIERIVSTVPGGAANVQDIYPLAPLQEGILFHHLMAGERDPYLVAGLVCVDTKAQLDAYLKALQAVIDRHDILRTAIAWEGLSEPVQVVWRSADLPVEEIELDSVEGDVAEQLHARFNPRHFRIELIRAPLLRIYIAYDPIRGRWLAMELVHHLVGDNSAAVVMESEIQAHLLGQTDRLSAAIPFRNLVAQARLGVSREEHEVFFREMLEDVEEPTAAFGLEVQGDGTGIEKAQILLDKDLAGRVRQQARRLGISPASLFHVAWAKVLAQTSGREDVVFGTVVFGRMQGGTGSDRGMGLFINTLPVRLQLEKEEVESSVVQTHRMLAELMRHEHASLALAQSCSGVRPPTPLFTSLLNYRHSQIADQRSSAEVLQAWKGFETLHGDEGTNFPLTFSIDDKGENFLLTAQVQAPIEPQRVCGYVSTALASLVEALEIAPRTTVRTLKVLGDEEQLQVLYEWNQTQKEWSGPACVHELFEEQTSRTPHALAVACEDSSLTYGELNIQANRLAHYLRELGVRPDARVAICLERSLEMVIGLMAVLKAGGAYVPLDPAYPEERLKYMVADSTPVVLLTRGDLQSLFSGISENLTVLDFDNPSAWQQRPETNLAGSSVGLTSEHLAYVIYTSGSTGNPKGVMGLHRSTINRLMWMYEKYPFESGEVCCAKSSFSFVDAICELFGPLLKGVPIVVLPSAVSQNLEKVTQVLALYRVTRIVLVPSLLRAMLESQVSTHFGVPHMKYWFTSGEPLPRKLANEFFERVENGKLVNLYGSSEDAADVTCHEVESGTAIAAMPVPIGQPITNTQAYILDANLQPAPPGVKGELYFAGAGIARGYLQRPDWTAERFIPDPFADDSKSRMYKTGDVGRWRADGTIEFVGRDDFQVKVRGFRIEPGEIEARLSEYEGVKQAVVVTREDALGEKRLVAYYTLERGEIETKAESGKMGSHVGAEDLRGYLTRKLPEYMVPAAYVCLEQLPLTGSGKLDRRALPAPEGDAYAACVYEAPEGEIETAVAGIWSQVLHVEKIGRYDNFFVIGGHSLLAVRVIARLRKILEVEIGISDLFARPVLSAFAERIVDVQLEVFDSVELANVLKQMEES